MRVLFEMNRLYGSVVLLSLLCLSPQVWGQDETGIKVVIHRDGASTDSDVIKAHAEIRQKLSKKMDIEFSEAELGRILQVVAEKLDVALVIDPVGLEEAAVTKDQIITFKLKGVSEKSALRLFLKSLNLIYEIDNEALIITSIEKAAEKQTFKVYDCRDLLEFVPKVRPGRNPMFEGMGGAGGGGGGSFAVNDEPTPAKASKPTVVKPEQSNKAADSKVLVLDGYGLGLVIQNTIDRDSWHDNGGKGTIEHFAGLLIIRQTEQGHDEIERLLSTMRELVKTPTKEKP